MYASGPLKHRQGIANYILVISYVSISGLLLGMHLVTVGVVTAACTCTSNIFPWQQRISVIHNHDFLQGQLYLPAGAINTAEYQAVEVEAKAPTTTTTDLGIKRHFEVRQVIKNGTLCFLSVIKKIVSLNFVFKSHIDQPGYPRDVICHAPKLGTHIHV